MKRVIWILLILVPISCGKNQQGLYPVSGRVTWHGQPAAGATVYFHREPITTSQDQVTMGVVNEDGSYHLVYGSLGAGARPGDYAVTVEWKQVKSRQKGGPQRASDRLNGRFADPARSTFHVTIKPRRNELAAIDLAE